MRDELKAREREVIENHVRHVDLQVLDALLRIEELLTELLANKKPQAVAEVKTKSKR